MGRVGSLSAGGVLVFSPSLVPGSQSGAGATLLGTVNRAAAGAPLAGVLHHRVRRHLGERDHGHSRQLPHQRSQRRCNPSFGRARGLRFRVGGDERDGECNRQLFSRLFPTNTSPPNSNKASVTGVVMDSGNERRSAGRIGERDVRCDDCAGTDCHGRTFQVRGITTGKR